MSDSYRPTLEVRSANIAEVDHPERTITVLAMPYERPTDKVVYRGRNYVESFARGAFSGINDRQEKIGVRLEHKGPTVGKVTEWRDSADALYCDMRIAKTSTGDDVLTLAAERMLFPSIEFYLKRHSDQELIHRTDPGRRYIKRAFVANVAMTDMPAYDHVDVLSVRSAVAPQLDEEPISTPRLDEWLEWLASKRAGLSA